MGMAYKRCVQSEVRKPEMEISDVGGISADKRPDIHVKTKPSPGIGDLSDTHTGNDALTAIRPGIHTESLYLGVPGRE